MTTTTPIAEPVETASAQTVAPVATAQTLSILALILGLVSFVGVGFPAAVAALVLGVLAWNREPTGHTMALIGIIAAILHLAGGLIIALLGLAFFLPFSGLFLALPFL